MLRTNLDRAIRFLRHRKGWRQTDLSDRSSVPRTLISKLERGLIGGVRIASLERVATALGASVHVELRWRGEQMDRLLHAAHASIQRAVAARLTGWGWQVRVEVSFNHYGDRGRIDLIAFHPELRLLLIVEIKSALGDLQETLGRLDVKARVGRRVARECGWGDVSAVIPTLVIGDLRSARAAIAAHEPLFDAYPVRGRSAIAWLRRPGMAAPRGLLWFEPLPPRDGTVGVRRRVRRAEAS